MRVVSSSYVDQAQADTAHGVDLEGTLDGVQLAAQPLDHRLHMRTISQMIVAPDPVLQIGERPHVTDFLQEADQEVVLER